MKIEAQTEKQVTIFDLFDEWKKLTPENREKARAFMAELMARPEACRGRS